MESKTKKVLAVGLSAIFISSIILIVILLPIVLRPPSITFSVSIPDLTIDASKPACNRTINISNYITPTLPTSQISISTNYTNAPWNSRVSIMGTNLTFQTFNFPMNGYYSIKITVTYQGVSINDEITFLLTSKNTWTWMSGNNSLDNNGTYGTKGVADAANVPGARASPAAWTDTSGNFWLFGGYGKSNLSSSFGRLNDLWMYNICDSTWMWVSGNYSLNNNGTYGTKGVSDAANVPGARSSSAAWTDASGNLWLFGGYGYGNYSLGYPVYLNDLWMYNISDSTWTWVSGNYSENNYGTYGTKGVADPDNMPGARMNIGTWTDADGNFWLFGGSGIGNVSDGYLNDLWMYNVSDSTWTWMSGNYSVNNKGIYGTKGVADADNMPGARASSAAWKDISGNLWLFGGLGYDNQSGSDYLNDLWMYNISDSTWMWVSGNYSLNNKGIYGTKGVADADNMPGARSSLAAWTDISGNFWLLGGVGYNNATAAYLNDLWMYNISDSTWIWVSGNYSTNNPGTYGTEGVADTNNAPGARFMDVDWIDTSGNLWLFGGYGYDHIGATSGYLNDLWKYVI